MALTKVTSSVLDQYAVFPSGTVMLFQQTSAPTGWTKQTTHDNKSLRVVSGSTSSGGSVGFSSVFASNLSVGSTTLTTTQMPAHNHSGSTDTAGAHQHGLWRSNATYSGGGADMPICDPNSGDTGNSYSDVWMGSAGSHSHVLSINNAGSGGSHTHSLNLDLQYVDVIFATKD